jgi:hypothetical protein
MGWIPPSAVSQARLQAARAIRSSLFNHAPVSAENPTIRTGSTVLKASPVAPKMRDYYYPDVDYLKLSEQDPSLADLNLKDTFVEARLAKEAEWTKRGKLVRVGSEFECFLVSSFKREYILMDVHLFHVVLTGRRKKVEGEGKGKKKKK